MKINKLSFHLDIIYYYFIVICVVFGSRDTWIVKNDIRIMYMGLMLSLMVFVPFLISIPRIGYNRVRIVTILVVIILASMLLNFDFSGYSLFINFAVALFVTEYIPFEEYFSIFDNVVYILTCISLVVLCFRNILGIEFLKEFIVVFDNEALPWGFRLYGFFREPAMFCVYLGLGCAYQLFISEKTNVFRVFVYLSAILLTGSTTGYIAIAWALICYIVHNKNKRIVLIIFIAICAVVISTRYNVFDYFLSRLSTQGPSAHSSNSRYFSIIGGALIGITHPLFGAGAVRSQYLYAEIVSELGQNYSWANMVTYLWASFGCVFIYVFLKGIYDMTCDRGKMVSVSVLVLIILLLCGETMTYSSVMWIFMLYGYGNRKKHDNRFFSGESR